MGHTVWGWVGFYVRLENQAKLAVYTRLTSASFHRHMELFVELSFSLGPYISDIETFNIMRPTSLNENIVACHLFSERMLFHFYWIAILIPSGRHRLILCQSKIIKVEVICWEFSVLMKALCGGAYSRIRFKGLTGALIGFHKRASDAVASTTCWGGMSSGEKQKRTRHLLSPFSLHH